MAQHITVIEYNKKWKDMFVTEAELIKGILGSNCAEIHHIGSTSVPGCVAKPIIDIMPTVFSLDKVDEAAEKFESIGYEYLGEFGIPGRRYLRKGGDERTHQIHIFDVRNKEQILRHLAFRNYLRANRSETNAYSELKKELARKYPYDIDGYCDGKAEFVKRAEAAALRDTAACAVLVEDELNRKLFRNFIRRQAVTKCRRFENGVWVLRDDPFIDDWSESDYEFLISCLKNTVRTEGFLCGAFVAGSLKGFVSVESQPFGSSGQYLDLSALHVSADMRGKGIGTELFASAKSWASSKGADKLYISAHSAAETQKFYSKTGCVDALEINEAHASAEPFDCQLEYVLK